MEKLYRYNGNYIRYDEFKTNIMECLREYKYATSSIISYVKQANEKDVLCAIKDLVVEYIKDNPHTLIKDVCEELKVKSSYVKDLVDEGRIDIDPKELNNLIVGMRKKEKLAERENKLKSFQLQLNELNRQTSNIEENNSNNTKKTEVGFHSNIVTRRK